METIRQEFADMSALFHSKMEQFRRDQQGIQHSQAVSQDSTFMAEFNNFKAFILDALKALQGQIEILCKSYDQIEMKTRRKILLIHGITEVKKENLRDVVTDFLHKYFKESKTSIKRCNRLGRSGKSKPRPILVKFQDVYDKNKVWFAKKSLKGTGITLSEFLTKERHNIFINARERFGVSKCWTNKGQILVCGSNGVHHQVTNLEELDAIPGPSSGNVLSESDTRSTKQDKISSVVTKTKRSARK